MTYSPLENLAAPWHDSPVRTTVPRLPAIALAALSVFAGIIPVHAAGSDLRHYVTARGGQLLDGEAPCRFLSFNIPNLLLVEDNVAFAELNPWRLPDPFEINDALAALQQMGGTVARTYVLSVRRTNDTPDIPRHVLGPGRFNADAFRAFDQVLQAANEHGIRLIVPLVDNWSWMGGRAEYAGFRGKSKDAFWTDRQIIDDFKQTIRFVLTRTNTLTGVRYADDKAILCWETGNELQSPAAWTREIAAYLKSLDPNHLVMDGFNATELRAESLAMDEVDIVTTHHYPGSAKSFAQLIRENQAKARNRKPYVIGEFGFVSTERMQEAIRAIQESGAAGGLLWSLRFRNRDGGFYWHSEPAGGNQYKAFHWPGSPIGEAYDEIALLAEVRQAAFAVRGMRPGPLPVPAPPHLLPIADSAAISWRGPVGAKTYVVERAGIPAGPWVVAADGVDESFVQYRPLFVDESASPGEWWYRVRARNESGLSEPSNIIGPVRVAEGIRVDELADFGKTEARLGNPEIRTRECRQAKEDAHRASGREGDGLVYRLPGPVTSFRVFAFFPGAVADLKFAVSADGRTYREVAPAKQTFFRGAGDYGYWQPVLYSADRVGFGGSYLNVQWSGPAQIGRVEIRHAYASPTAR